MKSNQLLKNLIAIVQLLIIGIGIFLWSFAAAHEMGDQDNKVLIEHRAKSNKFSS